MVLLRPLAAVLDRIGEDGPAFLAHVGVDERTPNDTVIAAPVVDEALEVIARERGDEALGLTLAREAALSRPVGLFPNLVWLSGTLRDALARSARFYSLVTRRGYLVLEDGDASGRATLTRCLLPGAARGRILVEYLFATLVLRARESAGKDFRAREMRFAHDVARHAPYEELFQSEVLFRQAADELVMEASMLELPLRGADPFTQEALESHVVALDLSPEPAPLVDRVRLAFGAQLRRGALPTLETIAARMGLAASSLRRRLRDEHTSFRAIAAAAQGEQARALLARGVPVKAVALQLGFSEPSAFSRAYKRWTGRAPSSTSNGPRSARRR